jgi:hypothetical protein
MEEMQKLFQAFVTIKDYCFSHKCNVDCVFFLLGGGCQLVQNKMPRAWGSNDTIIKGMHAQELQPVVEKKESDELEKS